MLCIKHDTSFLDAVQCGYFTNQGRGMLFYYSFFKMSRLLLIILLWQVADKARYEEAFQENILSKKRDFRLKGA